MRAGLLSDHEVIRLVNEKFVSTWVLIDDLKQNADKQPRLADTLLKHWEYPLDLMFLNTHGEFVTKLNTFRDLPNAHPDVGHQENPFERHGPSHTDVFLRHAKRFLGGG